VVNAAFLAAMENILRLYNLPYDEAHPLLCFDERPCFLIGDKVEGLEMKPGQVRKEHYEYEKNGSCCLLAAIEPLTGKRVAMVCDQRRKTEYAEFMQELASHYPNAKKIRLVQDNLNTHNASSFYERFDAESAFQLANRFEFHYTPKSGSWLNMVETEFSVLARQCLKRRIPTKEILEEQVLAIFKERSDHQVKINWKFSITDARKKMKRHYVKVNPSNEKD
jgi:hypothetical protein